MSWLDDAVNRVRQWKAQRAAVLAAIADNEDLSEEACRRAGHEQRADFLAANQRPASTTVTPEEAYAEGLVEAVIATSSSREVNGMPSVLFHRQKGGRPPSNTTGMLVVYISDAGAQRRKAKLKRLKEAVVGAQQPWSVVSGVFRSSFHRVRDKKVKDLQEALELQLQLLQIADVHAKKSSLGDDARTAQRKVVAQQEKVCGILYDRLAGWMKGGFFGLPPSCSLPEGSWDEGGLWSKTSIIKQKRTPWESETASLQGGAKDYGCVSIGAPPLYHLDSISRSVGTV